MNLEKLNQWITLLANLGVLAGIIVVAIELRQTQTEMQGEASTMRAEMMRQTNLWALEFNIDEFGRKVSEGEEPNSDETQRARTFFSNILRYFENLHYQHEIGILDEEIWEANTVTIDRMCRGENLPFSYAYPNGITGSGYRSSFVELINPPCRE